jgi:hypothetical protein
MEVAINVAFGAWCFRSELRIAHFHPHKVFNSCRRRSDAMLPRLSKKRVVFQEAEPEPAFISARRNALQDLKSIDSIRISASGRGSARYVVEVLTDSLLCRTTTSTESSRSSASRTPSEVCESPDESSSSVRIERKLEDFVDLRDKLYKVMFSAHHRQYCKFCLHVMDAVITGVDPDGFFFTLLGQERTVCKLTRFTEELLAPTIQHACASTQGCCSAQTLVPRSLHAFLFTPDWRR